MMKLTTIIGLFILCLVSPQTLFAQQTIVYNGKTIVNPERTELQLGTYGTSFSIAIEEFDLSKFSAQDNMQNPTKGYVLVLDVDLIKKLPFPIKPSDSVSVGLSNIALGLQNQTATSSKINSINKSKINSEKESLQPKKINVEEAARKITQQMQEGTISPEEAIKKIEALSKPLLDEVDNAYATNIAIEEEQKKPNYGITFFDFKTLTQANMFSGRLYIDELTKEKIKLRLQGVHYRECLTKRAPSSAEAEKDCKKTDSKLVPGKVLDEGNVSLVIETKIKTFMDNRSN